MSVIAGVRLAGSELTFGHASQSGSDVTLEAESIVPISAAVMPYFWINTAASDAAKRALRQSEYVESVTLIDGTEEKQLLRIEWTEQPTGLLSIMTDTEAIVLDAVLTANEWTFQLRFPAYEDLSTFSRRCTEQDISIQLEGLNDPRQASDESRFDLTADQRAVLVTAVERGYFDVPRNVTIEELGEALGLSDSTVSQQLRRGLATLLDATLRETTSDET